MDKQFRELERIFDATGDSQTLEKLQQSLLRWHDLETWELLAEQDDAIATKYIETLRKYFNVPDTVYINVYEDFTARTYVECYQSEITSIRRWLRTFYETNPIFFQGFEIDEPEIDPIEDPFDSIFGPLDYFSPTPRIEPPAEISIEVDSKSCFRNYPDEFIEYLRRRGAEFHPEMDEAEQTQLIRRYAPINKHGKREFGVGFQIINSFDEGIPPAETSERYAPVWLNSYHPHSVLGGPEEGGWHYTIREPVASIFVGHQLITQDEIVQFPDSPLIEEARDFLQLYMAPEVVYLAEAHPAMFYPLIRPHYE